MAEFSPRCGENLGERPAGFRRCRDSGNVAPIGTHWPVNSSVPDQMTELVPASLLIDIRRMIDSVRARVAADVNAELPFVFWPVGRRIRDDVLGGERVGYGQRIFPALALRLRCEYGRGWSEQQLRHWICAVEVFPDESILSALRRELSWTHLKMLMSVDDPLKRDFYIELCRLERWSSRQLQERMQAAPIYRDGTCQT